MGISSSDRRAPAPARFGLVDAAAAASTLGVSRSTLYAYVSRGLIRSEPHPDDPRAHLYRADDLAALSLRKARLRKPRSAAATALDWGLPVLRTAITRIAEGTLSYRGRDATTLAETATLEEVAALLWQSGGSDPFAGTSFDPTMVAGWLATLEQLGSRSPTERALALLPSLLPRAATTIRSRVAALGEAAALVRAIATAIAGDPRLPALPLHQALATAWRQPEAADPIRRALVLCADHELNASAFAVRVVASTGCKLAGALLAGLAALSGPLHGGVTDLLRTLTESARDPTDAERLVTARIARGQMLHGFHHPLYPDGDPRARAILASIRLDPVMTAMRDAAALAGIHASLDFALLALERAANLPCGTALGIFAIGRTAGWIAHALEQHASGGLIRPRAEYVTAAAVPVP